MSKYHLPAIVEVKVYDVEDRISINHKLFLVIPSVMFLVVFKFRKSGKGLKTKWDESTAFGFN